MFAAVRGDAALISAWIDPDAARRPESLTEKSANKINLRFVIVSRGWREAPSVSEAIQEWQAQTGLLRGKSSSQ
jgi:hypothetical protein